MGQQQPQYVQQPQYIQPQPQYVTQPLVQPQPIVQQEYGGQGTAPQAYVQPTAPISSSSQPGGEGNSQYVTKE